MINRAWALARIVAVSALAAAPGFAAPAGNIRTIDGTAFWDGDPGPINPGSFWTSGQYKYDPNGYLERNARDPDQMHLMTLYGAHSGRENCVFRRRVAVTTWDFNHPYLRVCRHPGAN